MRIGIFGGTFDPPHLGHLILASEALYQCQLDHLLWVLTPTPPHKPNQKITPIETRLEMVLACIQDTPGFEFSSVDMDRSPPHYALETVQIFQRAHPSAEMFYIMGSDSLVNLHTWHHPMDFIRACNRIAVTNRTNKEIDLQAVENRLPGIGAKLQMINSMVLGISSTEIRKRVSVDAPVRFYLHLGVYEIIQKRGLYKTP